MENNRWYKCVFTPYMTWNCKQVTSEEKNNETEASNKVFISVNKNIPRTLDKMYITSQLYPSVVLDPPAANKFP